jgi:hypothetical protein
MTSCQESTTDDQCPLPITDEPITHYRLPILEMTIGEESVERSFQGN